MAKSGLIYTQPRVVCSKQANKSDLLYTYTYTYKPTRVALLYHTWPRVALFYTGQEEWSVLYTAKGELHYTGQEE